MNCSLFASAVNITLKRTVRYDGQEYSSPAELPPEIRAAYEKALHEVPAKMKFVFNGEQLADETTMPPSVRKLCDDIMGVIENNGEVTIPNGKAEPWLTTKEVVIAALFAGGIVALVAVRLAMG